MVTPEWVKLMNVGVVLIIKIIQLNLVQLGIYKWNGYSEHNRSKGQETGWKPTEVQFKKKNCIYCCPKGQEYYL